MRRTSENCSSTHSGEQKVGVLGTLASGEVGEAPDPATIEPRTRPCTPTDRTRSARTRPEAPRPPATARSGPAPPAVSGTPRSNGPPHRRCYSGLPVPVLQARKTHVKSSINPPRGAQGGRLPGSRAAPIRSRVNFREPPLGEVRGTSLPRIRVNRAIRLEASPTGNKCAVASGAASTPTRGWRRSPGASREHPSWSSSPRSCLPRSGRSDGRYASLACRWVLRP